MEAVGFIALVVVACSCIAAVIVGICTAHDRATILERRVKKLETVNGVTEDEIDRVAKVLPDNSRDQARDAILALRAK